MNNARNIRTLLALAGLTLACSTALPADGSEQLLRAALARLGQQGADVARHEATLASQTRDSLRHIDSALSPDNPIKGMYGGSPGTLMQQLGGTPAAQSVGMSSGSSSGFLKTGDCPTNLRHLAAKLPRYTDAELNALREAALASDMVEAFRSGQSMGYSSSRIASLSLQQSQESERSYQAAQACLEGFHVDPREAARRLADGSYQFGDGNSSDCARMVVASHYAQVVNKESAVVMACLARANP